MFPSRFIVKSLVRLVMYVKIILFHQPGRSASPVLHFQALGWESLENFIVFTIWVSKNVPGKLFSGNGYLNHPYNHHYHSIKLSESDSISSAMFSFSAACTFLTPIFNFHVVVFETICAIWQHRHKCLATAFAKFRATPVGGLLLILEYLSVPNKWYVCDCVSHLLVKSINFYTNSSCERRRVLFTVYFTGWTLR